MSRRYLVLGDNHGDTASLERVRDDVGDETIDFAVHVGDFTRAWRNEREGREPRAAAQLRAVEPHLEALDDLARHGLLWVWGNQEHFGDVDYELDVGTEVPDDGTVTVGGQRFTSSPAAVESNVILVTHMEHWRLVDHFDGRAHFCGNTHRGRHMNRRLNSSFLRVRDEERGTDRFGGYFLVDVDDTGLDVELRSIGSLERRECATHRERGLQFQPAGRDCMFCEDPTALFRELAASAFYGCTTDDETETVPREELVASACDLWTDPPTDFRAEFAAYLADVDDDRYAPLTSAGDDDLALAENSYAY